jgi:peptide subunit release factor 1 (eRF1)
MDASIKPVRANVEASATNLSAQLKTFEVRELGDQGAIYYVAEIPVSHRETLKFNLAVTPEGQSNTYRFSFEQQFYTE